MVTPFILSKLTGPRDLGIPISAVCNTSCFFCSNKQNPFHTERPGFLSLEEFYRELYFVRNTCLTDESRTLSLSNMFPGTVSEGEALLHPELPTILREIRRYLPSQMHLAITTNGSTLTDERISLLARYAPIDVSISIPSFTEKYWLKMLGTTNSNLFKTAIEAFDKLNDAGVPIHTSTVALPNLVGYDDLDNTIEQIIARKVNQLFFWYPAYTKYSPDSEFLRYASTLDHRELHEFITKKAKEHPTHQFGETGTLETITRYKLSDATIQELADSYYLGNVLWLTSHAAFQMIKAKIDSTVSLQAASNTVQFIENSTYGGNIICAGLLTIEDILAAIRKYATSETDLIVLPPPLFLNSLGEDLMGDSIFRLDREIDIPYILSKP